MQSRARLRPAEGYEIWAPTYEAETVVSSLEERLVRGVMPTSAGRWLLDIGCGTGRRLRGASDARMAVGVDLVPQMLEAGGAVGASVQRVAADARSLPFASASFDLLWCRLVLGHLQELHGAYREMARVSRPGSTVVVSDFHPAAAAAGHRRSFRDGRGNLIEIAHFVHDASAHARAANDCGWAHTATVEAAAGEPERVFYERAGRINQFRAESSLLLVLVMCFER